MYYAPIVTSWAFFSSFIMKRCNHDNRYFGSTNQSRKRRRIQRQLPQYVGLARTFFVPRLAMLFMIALCSLVNFVQISSLVIPSIGTSNVVNRQRSCNHQSIAKNLKSILALKHQRQSTPLFYNAETSSSRKSTLSGQQEQHMETNYENQGKIPQKQQQRDQPSNSFMAHYYPASSRQKKVTSRKIQLRWITQTVQKLIFRNKSTTSVPTVATEYNNSNSHPDSNNSSHAGNMSILYNNTAATESSAAQLLLGGLELLCMARTQAQVVEAGRMIESANVIQTQSIAIQERIIKATAMTGLLHIALRIVDHMVSDLQYLPSPVCQDAISNGLRRAGRIQQLNQLLLQLGSIAQPQNKSISLITFNTYLAALCDIVAGKDEAVQQQRSPADMASLAGYDVFDMNYKLAALDSAWYCISDLDRTKQRMAILPDSISYSTVIQAAAYIGNQTIVDAVWDKFRTDNVLPNIVAYNARLRSVTNTNAGGSSSTSTSIINRNSIKGKNGTRQKKRDQEILKVWDTEISSDPYVSYDKYTIDLLLLPLIRSGRVGDVEYLLDNFIKRNSESAVSNAFTAFLLTVVAGGELSTARALFEMYILPTLSPVVFGDAGGMMRMVRPTTRHFNALIEGYRKYCQSYRFNAHHNNETTTDMLDATVQAWSLYDIMKRSLNARPDSFTITSMMGICQTPTELSNLIFQAVTQFDIECSSVVLRAACKYFSHLFYFVTT